METIQQQKKYIPHYSRYRETICKSQKKYYDNNAEKLKKHVRDYYKNNTEYREKKIIQMREYRARKKAERLAQQSRVIQPLAA